MELFDFTFATPAENLACDEALLDACESSGTEVLRFWEPRGYFVVVGYGNSIGTEVNVAACEAENIPVLRRCSGGGTVLQGPGCLNYSLSLRVDRAAALQSISSANHFIMEQNRVALEGLLNRPSVRQAAPAGVAVHGCTDLAWDGRKFSGNSQRRRKNSLLFHGTFLLRFDLSRVETLLPVPKRQPAYRENRSHTSFLRNLEVDVDSVKAALRSAWNATTPLGNIPHEAIASLVRDRYGTREWNFNFRNG
jgi:lipoate-protein ligase A